MDEGLNPPRELNERLRRLAGRYPKAPWSGHCDFRSITEAWNGAVFADHFGISGSMIVFGGGHADYYGSDVHAFDLASREWRRLSDGYVTGTAADYGEGAVYPCAVYPDGSPLPPHTYEYVQYDPVGNDYLLLKGQRELGRKVTPTPIPHMFNLDSLRWRRGPRHEIAALNSAGCTTWDPARRILWGNAGNDGDTFIGFRPDGDNDDGTVGSWSRHYPNKLPGVADHNAMAIDPSRDVILVSVHAENSLYLIDPSAPENAAVRTASRGVAPVLAPYAALAYAPALGSFAYYSAADGANVYSITAPEGVNFGQLASRDWMWRPLDGSENTLDPITDAAAISRGPVKRNHTFGRFRVATYGSIDLAILVRHVDTPVYVMRLT
jgi:hypothetical protein